MGVYEAVYDMFMFHWQLVHARCVFCVLCLLHLKLLRLYICQTYTVLQGYIYIGKKYGLYHGHLHIHIYGCIICITEIIYTI